MICHLRFTLQEKKPIQYFTTVVKRLGWLIALTLSKSNLIKSYCFFSLRCNFIHKWQNHTSWCLWNTTPRGYLFIVLLFLLNCKNHTSLSSVPYIYMNIIINKVLKHHDVLVNDTLMCGNKQSLLFVF